MHATCAPALNMLGLLGNSSMTDHQVDLRSWSQTLTAPADPFKPYPRQQGPSFPAASDVHGYSRGTREDTSRSSSPTGKGRSATAMGSRFASPEPSQQPQQQYQDHKQHYDPQHNQQQSMGTVQTEYGQPQLQQPRSPLFGRENGAAPGGTASPVMQQQSYGSLESPHTQGMCIAILTRTARVYSN